MIHLWPKVDQQIERSFTSEKRKLVPAHYSTSRVDHRAQWVVGHHQSCVERTRMDLLYEEGSQQALEDGEFTPDELRKPCDCGHAQLQVHAWPAPAGEGVMCVVSNGLIHVPGEYPSLGFRDVCGDISGIKNQWFRRVDDRTGDAPIREAWERLKWEWRRPDGPEAWLPPNGLYLFVETCERCDTVYSPKLCDGSIREDGDGGHEHACPTRAHPQCGHARMVGDLKQVEDVMTQWYGRCTQRVQYWARDGFAARQSAQAFRFSAPGNEPVWVDRELLR